MKIKHDAYNLQYADGPKIFVVRQPVPSAKPELLLRMHILMTAVDVCTKPLRSGVELYTDCLADSTGFCNITPAICSASILRACPMLHF